MPDHRKGSGIDHTDPERAIAAAATRWEFFLTAAPLPVTGAVGAPVTPLAVK